MNTALVKKELEDILSERLYIFAFLVQFVIVSGVLFAALLYTSVAAPETSTFVQVSRPRIGVIGEDPLITSALEKNLELVPVSGNPFTAIEGEGLVAVLVINAEDDFEIYLDNTNLLSGYADTILGIALAERGDALRRRTLEEKIESAEAVLNPINIVEERFGEKAWNKPPEFIVIMYGLLLPFILLLPTFLAANMVTDSIVGEKERKTYEALVSAPITKTDIILSKVAPIIAIALIQSLVWMILLILRDVPVYNIPLLLLVLLVINAIFIGLGVLISAFSDTLKESNLAVTIAILITTIGIFAPISLQSKIQSLNPLTLITKLASNPVVPLNVLVPIIPLSAAALLILFLGVTALKRIETLRL